MSTNKKTVQWPLLATHLGTIMFMMACAVVGSGTQTTNDDSIQVEDGVIEVKNENGDWTPIAGESAFELVGELENTDPWTVSGTTLKTNEFTQIDEGLEIGNLVRVQGTVLEDGTWLAYSIESTDEQTDPVIVLIGVIDSVDPWSVNGISLNVTDETDIQGGITVGMIVRVEILFLEDGTWEVLSIAPLGESIETTGCVTVVATIVSVSGDEVQFLGWPTTVLLGDGVFNGSDESEASDNDQGEDEDINQQNEEEDGDTLSAGQTVLVVACTSEDGQIVIVQITLISEVDAGDASANGEKVLVCHKPSKKPHTLSIASPAVPAHLAHGDTLGACP